MKQGFAVLGFCLAAGLAMATNEVRRLAMPPRYSRGNTGIKPVQAIDYAAWVSHPQVRPDETVFLKYRAKFQSIAGKPLRLHVSADERFALSLDGRLIARGPDRGTVERWTYSSYELSLDPGEHVLEAVVWKLGGLAPLAQLSYRNGFVCKAEGDYDRLLTTGGTGSLWRVGRLTGLEGYRMPETGFGVGCQFRQRGQSPFRQELDRWAVPAVAVPAMTPSSGSCGLNRPGWRLFPSELPDQLERPCAPGLFRAAATTADAARFFAATDAASPDCAAWNALLREGKAMTIPAHSERTLLWDLGDYYCAYPELEACGGAGSEIDWAWAESLFDAKGEKGDRNAFAGKRFQAAWDTVLPSGGDCYFTTPWWRCGRWCELRVKTGAEPLALKRLGLIESRYPMVPTFSFACDDPTLGPVQQICLRGLQMCSHEMGFDCPYYEQQMYPGDTRIQLLVHSAVSPDDRLIRRAIELYDFSRREDGMIGMNFPTRGVQDSATYSLVWPLMFRDYLYWHDNLPWLRSRLPGLCATLDGFRAYANADGLLENLPGWNFMDWVPSWPGGVAPDGDGLSSINNLFYVLALQSAGDVEAALGEEGLATYSRALAGNIGRRIVSLFWDSSRRMLADDRAHRHFSEHAQCLALLAGVLHDQQANDAFNGLVTAPDLARATVYFSHYLFETYVKCGRGDLVLKRLDLWRDYVKAGLKTPLESPGNARSDCHAWGAHPIYHLQTGIAGVTPAAPCFKRVRVAPQPGPLKEIHSRTPHPSGVIGIDLTFTNGVQGKVTLPPGLTGTFVWDGNSQPLAPGENAINRCKQTGLRGY